MTERWTPSIVSDQLEEAILTLKKLPPVVVQGYFNLWPQIKYDPLEVLQQERKIIRLAASTAAITRMEQTLDWMKWLEVEERKLIWKRAAKKRWKEICWEFGCDRSTAWRKWVIALTKISAHLNNGDR
ncbi:MAG: DUF6362 family protein [Alphaproteobacteria bacterium]|nr:DUF6362 family protein [Alphaproteobacteria bacterium]